MTLKSLIGKTAVFVIESIAVELNHKTFSVIADPEESSKSEAGVNYAAFSQLITSLREP